MPSTPEKSTEAFKIVADWAKWTITVETAVVVAVGALFGTGEVFSWTAKVTGSVTVGSFLISTVAAAMLLASLPDVEQQNLDPDMSVWTTADSVAGVTLQSLAIFEAIFFGVGIVAVSALVMTLIWTY
ncbi:hypothetical protein M2164_004916 [Streptomyces sp. SAI-208]|uniref:hypothetical protein n=1 Tax=Streptomyces sp. SAI-208 TaxID=2940550 RepID=UPI002473C7B2|nr:hypothetical protein [Streptomyces sp. SAI-208]MDH6609281.1 hypothetical protein [Streptomyces sp. SAI-208]